jgi:predicted phage-related endonuclease
MNINAGAMLNAEARMNAIKRGLFAFEIDPIKRRDEWLRLRAPYVTASVAGALLDIHEFMTPYMLWTRFSGLVSSATLESPAMRRGRLLEPVAVELMREQYPQWQIERAHYFFADPVRRLGATPDAFARDPSRDGFGVIQIKSVEQSVFSRKWRTESLELTPPTWVAVQALVEADLCGAAWACVAALTVGFGVDLYLIEIPRLTSVIEILNDRLAEFWKAVENKKPPKIDYSRDRETLLALHGLDDGSTIDLTGWNRFQEIADADRLLANEIKDAKMQRDAGKAELLDRMGAATSAIIDGRVVATAKTVTRKAHVVNESKFRDVRIK